MVKGQVTNQKDVREVLGVASGDRIFFVEGGTARIVNSAVYAVTDSIQPSLIMIISSACAARYLLCVTTMTHFPSSCAVLFSNSIISPAVFSSRLPVGSSASSTFALLASALAMATRCCWPPDSSKTFLFQSSQGMLYLPEYFYLRCAKG